MHVQWVVFIKPHTTTTPAFTARKKMVIEMRGREGGEGGGGGGGGGEGGGWGGGGGENDIQ